MTIMPTNVTQILFIQEVVKPEIPTDPIVERLNLVEEEYNLLKEKIRKNGGGEDDIGVACLHEKDGMPPKQYEGPASYALPKKRRKSSLNVCLV